MSTHRPMNFAALALAVAAGMSAGPMPLSRGPIPTPSTREYVAPSKRARGRRKKKQQAKREDPPTPNEYLPHARKARRAYSSHSRGAAPSQPWRKVKNGGAIDGRGDYRSPKRLHRLALCAQAGMPKASGRQWIRLRRLIATARRSMGGRHA